MVLAGQGHDSVHRGRDHVADAEDERHQRHLLLQVLCGGPPGARAVAVAVGAAGGRARAVALRAAPSLRPNPAKDEDRHDGHQKGNDGVQRDGSESPRLQ